MTDSPGTVDTALGQVDVISRGAQKLGLAQRLRVPGTSLNSIEWKPAIQSYSSRRWGPASLQVVWWLSIHTGSKIAARAAKAHSPLVGGAGRAEGLARGSWAVLIGPLSKALQQVT
ncbi:hypothetical protein CFAM422_005787 [Trichoderma lentiforme]|uniref:Uncharacterized protein n=1 Tax=Trichoderma lentiforme TaxID=1567552 RepID=A0A9P4XFX1_9HYPO|nr:hypothetical protein CFAM422_005787 [Trichoderma lentiforme]